jgi:hypothetical protein
MVRQPSEVNPPIVMNWTITNSLLSVVLRTNHP